jgi:hypothetical protein
MNPEISDHITHNMFVVDPTKPWNATGLHIGAGKTYRINCITSLDAQQRPYSDMGLPCSPDGPSTWKGRIFDRLARDATSSLNPVGWIRKDRVKRLRVLKDRFGRTAHFLTLIGCIGKVSESDLQGNAFVIGSMLDFTADRSGELFVFSNDWPIDSSLKTEDQPYANNTGGVKLELMAL